MKRTIFTALVAIATFASCQKSEVLIEDNQYLTAEIEQIAQTKTYMDANNNIRWSEGDKVVAFMKSSLGLKYQVLLSSVGKTSASFENISGSDGNINAGTEWDHNIVYYPYSDAVDAEKSGSNYALNIVLPSEQTYAQESFGNGSMAMVAVSEDNNITFKNVLGGMKLQLKGTQKVTSIKLEGKNSEKLSGAATVTAYTDETKPAISMASGASTSVTLNCGSGVQLNESTATEFIISLPPVLFSNGFTVTVTDSDSQTYTVETDKANTVLRSSLLVMPEISIDALSGGEKEPQEGDYIDEYGVNYGQGVEIDGVVWAPVNCGYKAPTADSKGFPYGKLYQWGRKYGQGYSEEYDESVPVIESGGVSVLVGNDKVNENIFYIGVADYDNDWLYPHDGKLWNSGTESSPVKTEYDPCPDGWRIPTFTELNELCKNHSDWTTDSNGQSGYWFSGASSYTTEVPVIFFPSAGFRSFKGEAIIRSTCSYYWSSTPTNNYANLMANFNSDEVQTFGTRRANGCSVRCVHE